MAGARGGDILLGRLHLQFLRAQGRVVVEGHLHPRVFVGVFGQLRLEVFRQALEVGDRTAGEFGQRLVGIFDLVVRGDGVGARVSYWARASCTSVIGARPTSRRLLAKSNCFFSAIFRGFGGGQVFQLHEHVEVGGRGARDQLVAGRFQVVVAGFAERLALRRREMRVPSNTIWSSVTP